MSAAPIECARLIARLEKDRMRGVETSARAREFVRRTCGCVDCVTRRSKAPEKVKRKGGRWADALKNFVHKRRKGECGRCPAKSETTYCPACLQAICTPGSPLWRGPHEAAKARAKVGAEKARLDAAKTVRSLGAEERARIEQEMRAAGRLR